MDHSDNDSTQPDESSNSGLFLALGAAAVAVAAFAACKTLSRGSVQPAAQPASKQETKVRAT